MEASVKRPQNTGTSSASSPARAPLGSLTASLNSVSLGSPSRSGNTLSGSSLRDVIHKSTGPSRKQLPPSSAALAFSASTTSSASAALGTTKKVKPCNSASTQHRPKAVDENANPLIHASQKSGSDKVRDGSRSRNASPVKSSSKNGSSASLASVGGLGRMDVVSNDYEARSNSDGKKSPTKKAGKHYDRYIPSRSSSTSGNNSNDHTGPILEHTGPISESSDSTTRVIDSDISERLGQSLGLDPSKRILSFFAEPPAPQSEHSALLASYSRLPSKGSAGSSSSSTAAASRRRVATLPERALDAPGMIDDYYLNLLSWSSTNLVAIGLAESVFVWNAENGEVTPLCSVGGSGEAGGDTEGDDYICSVKFAEDGSYLSVGLSTGAIQVYDVTTGQLVRTMSGHLSRVPSLSWSGAILSSGCRTGEIWNSDVRVQQHRVAEMRGHRGEVCGLEWRAEVAGGLSGGGMGLLASGGNDNVVNVWDGRMTSAAKMSKTNHTAAVKALAWCPWTPSLLASGGGSSDRTIHFWNTTTSARLNSLVTPSQVTSIIWNPHAREFMSSHGIPDHQLSIWSYPSLAKVADIPQAHETRILHSCLSPDGSLVATASSDENLKIWKVFESKKSRSRSDGASGRMLGAKDIEEAETGIQRKNITSLKVR